MLKKLTPKQIVSHLQQFVDPLLERPFIRPADVQSCEVSGPDVHLRLRFGFPCQDIKAQWQADLHAFLQELPGIRQIDVVIEEKCRAHQPQKALPAVPNVKNIVAVASGKGGVGKSTTAVNIALALHHMGASVGLLDADIYGPNQPQMLGVKTQPDITPDKKFKPISVYGLQTMSIGYLVDRHAPMVWRGPMISKVLEQLLFDTKWDALDYLIVDMPPGTGDIPLTLSQKIPTVGSILVTTPQTVATLDVQKGIEMFNKVNVPILGVVENMATHICSHCGHRDAIFCEGGGEIIAKANHVPFLGRLPLDKQICWDSDQGKPTVAVDPFSPIAQCYKAIARLALIELAKRPVNHAINMPKVVVE